MDKNKNIKLRDIIKVINWNDINGVRRIHKDEFNKSFEVKNTIKKTGLYGDKYYVEIDVVMKCREVVNNELKEYYQERRILINTDKVVKLNNKINYLKQKWV